ncbi:MAG: RICIN domain-containing protein [Muribaculaceae bacterium]
MKKAISLIMLLAMALCANALENGFYIIRSANNRNYVIDNNGCNTSDGNNIHLWELNRTRAQIWHMTNLPDGTVTFANMSVLPNPLDQSTFHMLDLNGSGTFNGNNIHLWTYNGTRAQRWYLVRNSDGTYTIQSSVNRNYVVDNNGNNVYNGNNIQIWESNGSNAQRWIFERTTL